MDPGCSGVRATGGHKKELSFHTALDSFSFSFSFSFSARWERGSTAFSVQMIACHPPLGRTSLPIPDEDTLVSKVDLQFEPANPLPAACAAWEKKNTCYLIFFLSQAKSVAMFSM
jgi:hypothetical protein